jgi:hypothetical protein
MAFHRREIRGRQTIMLPESGDGVTDTAKANQGRAKPEL